MVEQSLDMGGVILIAVLVSFYVVYFLIGEPFWHEVTYYSELEQKNVSRTKKLNEYTVGSLLSLPFYLITYVFFGVVIAAALIIYPIIWTFLHPKTQAVLHKLVTTPLFKAR